ncbi:hypothetical protein BLNAU_22140 [Blattamonas nauphoetae]|uniref:Uncharacterized protein n=1 Tax=Blattamonas nauphoetae TaxID=2049346 RepID=A0ABQ9WTV4_9EUKA|nr:hypothetical protein BLNAU_22140 [Blattamonas nauphoetae]
MICRISSSDVFVSQSTIISSGYHCPFMVTGHQTGGQSTISLIRCSHTTPSQNLLPFVSLDRDGILTTGTDVYVLGTGLHLSNRTLILATGPLFSFGWPRSVSDPNSPGNSPIHQTSLISCSFRNMSSRLDPINFPTIGSQTSQTVFGCCVTNSFNHQHGTTMLNPSLGGNFLCQNTSFSSCRTKPNAEVDVWSKEYSAGDRIFNPVATSAKYTLCTFCEMTYEIAGNVSGAAICFRPSPSSLTIIQCFFHKCVSFGFDNDGGAVAFSCELSTEHHPFELRGSSFTECATTYESYTTSGGSLLCHCYTTAVVSDSVFEKSYAAGRGGSVDFRTGGATMTNCVFHSCSTGFFGAGLLLADIPSVTLSSIQFRNNTCNPKYQTATDMVVEKTEVSIFNSNTVTFCDTTSSGDTVFFVTVSGQNPEGYADGTLIEHVTKTAQITARKQTIDTDTMLLTMKLSISKPIRGNLHVLLEGSNVPRLVIIPFGSDSATSDTGSADITVGPTGVLPFGVDYNPRCVAIPGWDFVGSVYEVMWTLEGRNEARVSFLGVLLLDGSYEVEVTGPDGQNLLFPLVFASPSELTLSTTATLGDIDTIRYGDVYSVNWLRLNGVPVALPNSLSFTIPFPNADVSSIAKTDGNDSITLTFSGNGFVCPSYQLTLSTSDALLPPHSKTFTANRVSLTQLEEREAILYPLDGADLLYGRNYVLFSIISSDSRQTTSITSQPFETPVEPKRITKLTKKDESDEMKTANFEVEGRAMCENEEITFTVKKTADDTESSFKVTFSSAVSGSGSAVLFSKTASEIQLDYDTQYELVAAYDSTNGEVIVMPKLGFTTIEEPVRLVDFENSGMSDKQKTQDFEMDGTQLDASKKYVVELSIGKTRHASIVMSFNSESSKWEGAATVFPQQSPGLEYGKSYSVSKFGVDGTDSEDSLFFEASSVEITVEPPRLASVVISPAVGFNSSTLTISTRALTANKKYLMKLRGVPSSSGANADDSRSIEMSFSSGNVVEIARTLYPLDEADLLFGHSYTVESMTEDGNTTSMWIEDASSFSTPIEPERLVSIERSDFTDDLKTTIDLSFSSFALSASTNYKLILESVPKSGEQAHQRTLPLSTDASGNLVKYEAVLYPFATSESAKEQLSFSTNYKVFKIFNLQNGENEILFDSITTSFETPAEPKRITQLSKKDESDEMKKANFEVEGRAMCENEEITFTVKKTADDTESSFKVTFSSAVSGSGSAVLFSKTASEIQLDYDTQYELVAAYDSTNGEVIVMPKLGFTTIEEPVRLVDFENSGMSDKQKTQDFEMDGTQLDASKKYVVELSIGKTRHASIVMSFNLESSKWEGAATVFPQQSPGLEYGKSYSVSKFRVDGTESEDSLFFEASSVVITVEPPRLASVVISPAVGYNSSTLTITTSALTANRKYLLKLRGIPSSSRTNADDERSIELTFSSGNVVVIARTLYPLNEADLLFGHSYTVESMTEEGNATSMWIEDASSFSTPIEPERLVTIERSDFTDDLKTTIDLTFSSFALSASANYRLILESVPKSGEQVHQRTLPLTTDASGNLEKYQAVLYPFATDESAKERLSFSTTYKVFKIFNLQNGEDEILFDKITTSFETPAEPARIERCIGRTLSPDCTKVTLLLEGRALPNLLGTISLMDGPTRWTSENAVFISTTRCSAVFSVGHVETSSDLKYGKDYLLAVNADGTSGFVVNAGIAITIPFPPVVSHASFAFSSSSTRKGTVTLTGTDLPTSSSYLVTTTPPATFTLSFSSPTSGTSADLSLGNNGVLDFSTTYTITSIVKVGDSSDVIFLAGEVCFETGEKPRELEVIVKEGGHRDTLDCGEYANPCGTVADGWKRREAESVEQELVTLKIDIVAYFGACMAINHESLQIVGLHSSTPRVVVDDSLSCTSASQRGVVWVDSGLLKLESLVLELPSLSLSMSPVPPLYVVQGRGTFSCDSVTITNQHGERVGIGLASLSEGQLALTRLSMKNLVFSDHVGLLAVESDSNPITFSLQLSQFRNISTTNHPLFVLTSQSAISSFSLADSSFISTLRFQSELSDDHTPLILISQAHSSFEMSNCVFERSGCVDQHATFISPVLHLTHTASSARLRFSVHLSSCLFVDSFPSSAQASAAIVISTSNTPSTISFPHSWFESTASSSPPFARDSNGVPLMDWKRRAAFPSSSSPIAVLVERGALLPAVSRTGSVFSNTQLKLSPTTTRKPLQ